MARTFLFFWVFTLPFAICHGVDEHPWEPMVLIFITTYGFIGLEYVAMELDDPFGDDPNDFDDSGMAQLVYEDICYAIYKLDGSEWATRLRNKVLSRPMSPSNGAKKTGANSSPTKAKAGLDRKASRYSDKSKQSLKSAKSKQSLGSAKSKQSLSSPKSNKSFASAKSSQSVSSAKSKQSVSSAKSKQSIASAKSTQSFASVKSTQSFASAKSTQSIASAKSKQSTARLSAVNSTHSLKSGVIPSDAVSVRFAESVVGIDEVAFEIDEEGEFDFEGDLDDEEEEEEYYRGFNAREEMFSASERASYFY